MILRYNCNICYIFQIIGQYAKYRNLIIIKFIIWISFSTGVLLSGCINTEGTIRIKGTVTDEFTKTPIPWRNIIVQGLVQNDKKLVPIDAGQFTTDSSGYFSYSFRKVKDAYNYNFSFVGDSDYAFIARRISLVLLERNAKYLDFSLNKLVDLTIRIYRKSKTPVSDTLYLSWKSDGIDGRILYPYKIDNYNLTTNLDLIWVGGDVKSTIKTRTFADKETRIRWVLYRNGQMKEIIDTIICKRDLANSVNFTY